MKIGMSYSEALQLIKKFKNSNASVKFINRHTVEIDYYLKLELSITRIESYTIVFGYKLLGVLGFLAKGLQFLVQDKFNNLIVQLDTANSEIIINLNQIDGLKKVMEIYRLSSIHFDETCINLELELNA